MAFTDLTITAESSKFHVSNVKMYEYLDQARYDWYHFCILLGVEAVLVHISADFKKEIFHQDQLHFRTWLERVGNTSFALKQMVTNNREELVVSSEVIMATINRATRTKVPVPDELRSLVGKDSLLDVKAKKNG
jgi:acyl-CoA thioesterase FadM